MGLFNVIKGAYPALVQVDKSLPVKATADHPIERGSCIKVVTDSSVTKFEIAAAADKGGAAAPGAYIYFALMGEDDMSAGMAGDAQISGGTAKITGLACSQPMEIETSMYSGTPTLGQFLSLADYGLLAAHATNETAYGQVTQGVTTRWANDAVAVTGWRTGNKVNVIRLRTLYIPNLAIS